MHGRYYSRVTLAYGGLGGLGTKREKGSDTMEALNTERIKGYKLSIYQDEWLRGDVYGYTIETPDGDIVDSCWGFFGYDSCLSDARDVAKGLKPIERTRVHLGKSKTLTAHFTRSA